MYIVREVNINIGYTNHLHCAMCKKLCLFWWHTHTKRNKMCIRVTTRGVGQVARCWTRQVYRGIGRWTAIPTTAWGLCCLKIMYIYAWTNIYACTQQYYQHIEKKHGIIIQRKMKLENLFKLKINTIEVKNLSNVIFQHSNNSKCLTFLLN